MNVQKPELSLLCKIGAIVVHVDELLSAGGHPADEIVIKQLIADQEVKEWIEGMGPLLPMKRVADDDSK